MDDYVRYQRHMDLANIFEEGCMTKGVRFDPSLSDLTADRHMPPTSQIQFNDEIAVQFCALFMYMSYYFRSYQVHTSWSLGMGFGNHQI